MKSIFFWSFHYASAKIDWFLFFFFFVFFFQMKNHDSFSYAKVNRFKIWSSLIYVELFIFALNKKPFRFCPERISYSIDKRPSVFYFLVGKFERSKRIRCHEIHAYAKQWNVSFQSKLNVTLCLCTCIGFCLLCKAGCFFSSYFRYRIYLAFTMAMHVISHAIELVHWYTIRTIKLWFVIIELYHLSLVVTYRFS